MKENEIIKIFYWLKGKKRLSNFIVEKEKKV